MSSNSNTVVCMKPKDLGCNAAKCRNLKLMSNYWCDRCCYKRETFSPIAPPATAEWMGAAGGGGSGGERMIHINVASKCDLKLILHLQSTWLYITDAFCAFSLFGYHYTKHLTFTSELMPPSKDFCREQGMPDKKWSQDTVQEPTLSNHFTWNRPSASSIHYLW